MIPLFAPGGVLVFGSGPPVSGPASDATLAVVCRAWAAGADVTTVSPRPGSAEWVARISGPMSGYRLESVRRAAGTPVRLVLGVEAGIPAPAALAGGRSGLARPGAGRSWWRMAVRTGTAAWQHIVGRVAVAGLRPVLDRFEHVVVVLSGPTGSSRSVLAGLWPHVDAVLVTPEGAKEARRLGVPPAVLHSLMIARTSFPRDGVSPLGPPEVTVKDRPVWLLGVLGRQVFGRRFPYVRVHTIETARKVRRVTRQVRSR